MDDISKLIDGKTISAQVNAETALEVAELKEKHGVTPALAVILVGEDPASQVYVSRKAKMCVELGIRSEKIVLPTETTQAELMEVIDRLNKDDSIHGILVQSPPPPQIDEKAIIDAIDPMKDVDCFHPQNVGKVLLGERTGFLPCTPWGVTVLLERSGITTAGKNVVVLGRSNIVGKPMAALLMGKGFTGDATVTVCHSRTKDLADHTRRADIIVTAAGVLGSLTADFVRPGQTVIDVSINWDESKHGIAGDAKFDEVAAIVDAITPVPGGVGTVTTSVLMKHVLEAAEKA